MTYETCIIDYLVSNPIADVLEPKKRKSSPVPTAAKKRLLPEESDAPTEQGPKGFDRGLEPYEILGKWLWLGPLTQCELCN